MRRALTLALLLLPLAASGCYGPGMFTDWSSISVGTFGKGWLRHGRGLPAKGEGYVVPELWRSRDARYGTDELVMAIERAARRVRREYPGSLLGVADLSRRGGGDSTLHRSHENGRDADLIYYAVDDKGRPVTPVNSMPRYDGQLVARPPRPTEGVRFGPFSPRRFDVRRNWALVRALLEDPYIEVQYLFCNTALRARLLAFAHSIGEDPGVLDRAEALLHQPGDSLPHDDHLHLRIYCAADDRAFGCVDRGPTRWWKKRWKYLPPYGEEAALAVADTLGRLGVAFRGLKGFIP